MADQTEQKRAKIPLKQFLADYKSGVSDREVMQRYALSARSLVSLIKTLVEKQVLTPHDLAQRKELTSRQELVKETQFLKSLFICPNCGHPHPQRFDVCPACGANPDHFAEPDRVVEDVTTTGGHFYVEDLTTSVYERPTTEVVKKDDTPQASSQNPKNASTSPRPAVKPAPAKSRSETSETSSKPSAEETTEKTSPFKSVRALFSRIKKK
jgi:hypothetical protein